MPEYLVHINPIDGDQAREIVVNLEKDNVIPEGSDVYVGVDSNVAVTHPPTARVEQVFRDGSGAVDTVRITS